MSGIYEKVSYLKGLAEGMEISKDSKEGKLLNAIIDVLGNMAEEIEFITDEQENINDMIMDINDELDLIDEFGEYDGDDDEDGDGMDYFEIECENCGEKVCIDEDALDSDDDIRCPNCNEIIEIEFDCDCEDCDC